MRTRRPDALDRIDAQRWWHRMPVVVFGASMAGLALSALVIAIGWPAMPDPVAVHAGTHGPDRWLPKADAVREAATFGALPFGCAILAVLPYRRTGRAAIGWSLTFAAMAPLFAAIWPLIALTTVTNALGG